MGHHQPNKQETGSWDLRPEGGHRAPQPPPRESGKPTPGEGHTHRPRRGLRGGCRDFTPPGAS